MKTPIMYITRVIKVNKEIEEYCEIHDNVKQNLLNYSTVTIDILNKKVLKNRLDYTNEKVYSFYIVKYGNKVQEAIRNFMIRHPEKAIEYAKQIDYKSLEGQPTVKE